MALLTCILFALIFIIFIIQHRRWYDPSMIMIAYWMVLTFAVARQAFGLFAISDWGYLIIIIGISSFCIGVGSGKKILSKVSFGTEQNYELDYRFIYLLYAVVIVFLFLNFRNVMSLLSQGYTWAKIRRLYSNQGTQTGYNEVLQSAFNVMMNQFISTPTVYASLPIAVADMTVGKRNKVLFILTLIMMFLWMMTSGGRSIVIWLIIYFSISFLIVKKMKIGISSIVKKVLKFSVIPLLAVFIYITVQRKGTEIDLLKEIYIYFPVGLKNLDYQIEQFDSANVPRFWGLSSFYGFIYPIVFILKQIGIIDYPQAIIDARYYSFTVLEPNSFIGLDMNAYATIMYQPYLDGGIIGVALILFLFGSLCGYYYTKVVNGEIQVRYLAIYLYLVQKLCFSQVRFYFTQTQQALALVILLLAFKTTQSYRGKVKFAFRKGY